MPIECPPLPPNMPIPHQMFTDGGLIGKNPSRDGGTWAFVAVHDLGESEILCDRSGVVLPADIGMDTVENNIVETIAILLALESLPVGWCGQLFSDNLNSIRRARYPKEIKKIVPKFIKERMIVACETREVEYILLGGHPTNAELEAGFRKDGARVSQWNVRADKLCCEEAARFKRS